MKRFITLYAEEGGGSSGGGTILSDAAAAAAPAQQQNPDPASAAPAASDFHSIIGKDGKFADKWTDSLPDTYKPYAGTLSKFPTVLDMGAAYANLEKKLGEKLAPPGADAKPEDVAKWRALVGAPEKPEGYGLKPPEKLPDGLTWDGEAANKLAAVAHKHHLTPAAAQDLLALSQELEAGKIGASKQKMEAYVGEQTKVLKDKWGEHYNEKVQAAVKASQKIPGIDLSDPEFGSNAKFIEAMYQVSLLMQPDTLTDNGKDAGATNAEQIAALIKSDDYLGKNGKEAQRRAAERHAALSGFKS